MHKFREYFRCRLSYLANIIYILVTFWMLFIIEFEKGLEMASSSTILYVLPSCTHRFFLYFLHKLANSCFSWLVVGSSVYHVFFKELERIMGTLGCWSQCYPCEVTFYLTTNDSYVFLFQMLLLFLALKIKDIFVRSSPVWKQRP